LLPGGFLGVDVFFVLSGFLITSLLLQEWNRAGSIDLKNFYIRRALRLIPALVTLALVLGGLALIFLARRDASLTYEGIWLSLSYVSNWLYAFGFVSADNPLGITWSLAIEEQFYLFWPLVLVLFLKSSLRRRWLVYGLSLGIAVVVFHRAWLLHQGASINRVYYASDTRADALLIGCLAGVLISWDKLPRNREFEVFMKGLAAFALVFLAFMAIAANRNQLMLYQGFAYTLIAFAAAAILLVVLVWPPGPALSVLKFYPLVWVGRVSYGLYLWHWPVRWYIYRQKTLPTSMARLLAAVFLSFALTTLSYYLVEKRFLRWKRRFSLPANAWDITGKAYESGDKSPHPIKSSASS